MVFGLRDLGLKGFDLGFLGLNLLLELRNSLYVLLLFGYEIFCCYIYSVLQSLYLIQVDLILLGLIRLYLGQLPLQSSLCLLDLLYSLLKLPDLMLIKPLLGLHLGALAFARHQLGLLQIRDFIFLNLYLGCFFFDTLLEGAYLSFELLLCVFAILDFRFKLLDLLLKV